MTGDENIDFYMGFIMFEGARGLAGLRGSNIIAPGVSFSIRDLVALKEKYRQFQKFTSREILN